MGAVAGLDASRWQYVFAHWHPSGGDELSAAFPAYAALAGAFVGAFPTVSDGSAERLRQWRALQPLFPLAMC